MPKLWIKEVNAWEFRVMYQCKKIETCETRQQAEDVIFCTENNDTDIKFNEVD